MTCRPNDGHRCRVRDGKVGTKSILCEKCNRLVHTKCTGISEVHKCYICYSAPGQDGNVGLQIGEEIKQKQVDRLYHIEC